LLPRRTVRVRKIVVRPGVDRGPVPALAPMVAPVHVRMMVRRRASSLAPAVMALAPMARVVRAAMVRAVPRAPVAPVVPADPAARAAASRRRPGVVRHSRASRPSAKGTHGRLDPRRC
jgi:hypothetical protein